jgi:hypothetical protein
VKLTVHTIAAMDRLKCRAHLAEDVQRLPQRQRLPLLLGQERLERLPRQALHRDEQVALALELCRAHFTHRQNVWVRHGHGALHFVHQARRGVLVSRQIGRVDLDRHFVAAAGVLSSMQCTMRSAVENITDAIPTEGLARELKPHYKPLRWA